MIKKVIIHTVIKKLSFFAILIYAFSTENICQATTIKHNLLQLKSTAVNTLPPPKTSTFDKNKYEYIKLDNGLTVLLISDSKAKSAYVALDVNAGSNRDPNERLGLAHFLEHMLFLGTDKYPTSNEYFEFVSKSNGYSNAYTSSCNTNYQLEIDTKFLQEALDRFAQFFISPKLDPKYIDKERKVVDSEHQKNIENDAWSCYNTRIITANPKSPDNRFHTGTLETLNNDGKLEHLLRDFFNTYYVANNMNLVVYSNSTIKTLKKWVKTSFSAVKSGEKIKPIEETYITKQQQAVTVNIKTKKDINYLNLEFFIPFAKKDIYTPAFEYIASFLEIGFTTPLKKQGLLVDTGYYADFHEEDDHLLYNITANLTKKGLEQYEEIAAIFFDMIDFIKNTEIKEYIAKEKQITTKQKFDFSKSSTSLTDVMRYARNMVVHPLENVIEAHYSDLDINCLNNILNSCSWNNVRLLLTGKDLPADTKLPFYKSKYKVTPFSKKFIARLANPKQQQFFAIPKENTFIAEDLAIKNKKKYSEPKQLVKELGLRSWYMPDIQFKIPEGRINILLSNSKPMQTAKDYILTSLYAELTQQSFNLVEIQANEAGLYSSVNAKQLGIELTVAGFQDKQISFLEDCITNLKKPTIEKNIFTAIKEKIIENIKNNKYSPPYSMTNSHFAEIINPSLFTDKELLEAINAIQLEDLNKFIKNFYNQLYVEIMVYGNYTENDAIKITDITREKLLTQDNRINIPVSTRKLIDGNFTFSYDVANNNSCCTNFYRIKQDFISGHALSSFTRNLVKSYFFDELRTEQQLGYIVFNSLLDSSYEPWLTFTVQSDIKNPEYISKKINEFFDNQIVRTEEMSKKDFNTYKINFIKMLLKDSESFNATASGIWHQITYYGGHFTTPLKVAKAVTAINKQDIINLLKNLKNGADGHISIQLWGINIKQTKKIATLGKTLAIIEIVLTTKL